MSMAEPGNQVVLRRWPGTTWLVAFGISSLILLLGGFAAGYLLQSQDRVIESNANDPVVVTAVAEERTPTIAPIPVQIGEGATVELAAAIPPGAVAAVVTSSPLEVGDVVAEGDLVIAVSGTPVFALFLVTPLYRDLALGMSGPDIASLNESLVRGGFMDTSPGDAYNQATRAGLARMYSSSGYTSAGDIPGSALHVSSVLQLTSKEMSVKKASLLNSKIDEGSTIFAATAPITAVTARVDALAVDELTTGTSANLQISGSNETLSGSVAHVSEFKDAVEDREGSFPGYDVVIEFEKPLSGAAGLSGLLTIDTGKEPRLAVPITAIRAEGGTSYVWVSKDGEFERVKVEVSSESDGWVFLSKDTLIEPGAEVRLEP